VIIDPDHKLKALSFLFNDTAASVKEAFEEVYGTESKVVKKSVTDTMNTYIFTIGYWGADLQWRNWYEPSVISSDPLSDCHYLHLTRRVLEFAL